MKRISEKEQYEAIRRLIKEGEVVSKARTFAAGQGQEDGKELSESLNEYFILKGLTDTGNPAIMRERLAHAADFFLTVTESGQLSEPQMQRLSDALNNIAQENAITEITTRL